MKNHDELKAAFEANPDKNELYVSSDGQIFTTTSAANVHQNSLNRDNHTNHAIEAEKREVEEVKVEVKPLDKMTKAELQAACKTSDIEFTEEETKAVLIEKIEAKIKAELDALGSEDTGSKE